MLAVVQSGALQGIRAESVAIEVNTGEKGEKKTVVVGLPDAAVKESMDRVTTALANSGFAVPDYHTTVNLAPGSLRKEGPMYDLPIALGLIASLRGSENPRLNEYLVAGELGLSGETRPVRGALALALLAREQGYRGLLLPPASATEAALVAGIRVYPVPSLDAAQQFLDGRRPIEPACSPLARWRANAAQCAGLDLSEIKGQARLRRAVEVAVSGQHNILIIGPPGSGKSMIAKRIPGIMPEPNIEEFLEILSVHSAAGKTVESEWRGFHRPFRSPHHTISDVGLLGGGTIPGPGEISLAHYGVLFLDELPEFRRSALEVLRQPIEDDEVTISRSAGKITLPASFMLVAAMNPCPCGYLGDGRHSCRCTPTQIQRYRNRISGPLLDRIDIHVEAPALSLDQLSQGTPGEDSATVRHRVQQARRRQLERFDGSRTYCNARMPHSGIRKHCGLSSDLTRLLQQAMEELQLSARAYDRVLKVARTIADLADSPEIRGSHLLEAIQYRGLDRRLWY